MKKRVVVTGTGVVAPNAIGNDHFIEALTNGDSGIRFIPEMKELKFNCQVGGIPKIENVNLSNYFSDLQLKQLKSKSIKYGCIAALDAWRQAGLPEENTDPKWNMSCIFGTGVSGVEPIKESVYMVDAGKVKRLGSAMVQQIMGSGISAYLGGMLGLGGQVTSNSSACSTGTEAIVMALKKIRNNEADVVLVGSCDSDGPHLWAGFDSMRVLDYKHNDEPEKASRPMSETAVGFVPGGGAGALVIESLEHAEQRGATILCEILGGHVNSGGQRNGGTMTAPNSDGVKRCIQNALRDADISQDDVDAINGHLTGTMADPIEIKNWSEVLNRKGKDFPFIQATKSLTGHCLAAAGAIESVAVVNQLNQQFFHGSANCEDLHPEISKSVDSEKIPLECSKEVELDIIVKANFGFGDVNAAVIFKKFKS